jgi:hypothetical protein
VRGNIAVIGADLIDENAKGIVDWFEPQVRYSRKDAAYEVEREALPFRYAEIVSRDPFVPRAALKRVAYRTPGRGPSIFSIVISCGVVSLMAWTVLRFAR